MLYSAPMWAKFVSILVVAVLLGWWLAGEKVTLSMGVAAAMILAAILLVERGGRRLAQGGSAA